MDWLRLMTALLLAFFLVSGFLLYMVLMVRLWSSRARETWAPRYTTIDRLQTRADMVASEGRAESQSESSQSQGEVKVFEPSSVQTDLVLPNNLVIPVRFVTRERDGLTEIHSKVPALLVITWLWPAVFAPLLPVCFIHLLGPQWIVVFSSIMMMLVVPLSSWLSFRGLRARSRDLRKTTLGV